MHVKKSNDSNGVSTVKVIWVLTRNAESISKYIAVHEYSPKVNFRSFYEKINSKNLT
jgi:hypothetical protein